MCPLLNAGARVGRTLPVHQRIHTGCCGHDSQELPGSGPAAEERGAGAQPWPRALGSQRSENAS